MSNLIQKIHAWIHWKYKAFKKQWAKKQKNTKVLHAEGEKQSMNFKNLYCAIRCSRLAGCHGGPQGRTAVHSVGSFCCVAFDRFQSAGCRKHSMGVCHCGPQWRSAVHSTGSRRRAAHGGFQRAGSNKHSMGVCRSGPQGWTAVHCIGNCCAECRKGLQKMETWKRNEAKFFLLSLLQASVSASTSFLCFSAWYGATSSLFFSCFMMLGHPPTKTSSKTKWMSKPLPRASAWSQIRGLEIGPPGNIPGRRKICSWFFVGWADLFFVSILFVSVFQIFFFSLSFLCFLVFCLFG